MRPLPLLLLLASLGACHPDPTAGDTDAHSDLPVADTDDSDAPSVDTDAPDTDVGYGTTFHLGPEVRCADPSARARRPYTLLDGGPDWQNQPFNATSDSVFVGGGVAVADFTGDGLLDVMTTAEGDTFGYWVQGPDLTFTDASNRLPGPLSRTAGVTAVDVDGDGDLDAFVGVFKGPDFLLINDGQGGFTDGTAAAGVAGPDNRRSMSSSWTDVDHDGDVDGFVAGYGRINSPEGIPPGDGSSIFLNQGNGTFVDQVPLMPAPSALHEAHTFSGAWIDADRDGWLDLYMVNDFGWIWPATLLHNNHGVLEPTEDLGLEFTRENMGLGVGDLNGDLIPDFLVASWQDNALFVSHGSSWFDESLRRGLRFHEPGGQVTGWGADLSDLDNDGDLDATVLFGFIAVNSGHVNPEAQPDGVWTQEPDGSFVDVSAEWGLDDAGRQRGSVWVDLDRDGFLDVVRADLRGPTDILLAACDDHAWLELELHQPGPNPFALGAEVVIRDGDQVWIRDVHAGGTSYGSAGPPEVHFGLGDRDTVDSVEVRWPDGVVETWTDVPTRRRVTVER